MAIGFAEVPPVSSPDKDDHEMSKEFLVDDRKVISPGLVGSIPA